MTQNEIEGGSKATYTVGATRGGGGYFSIGAPQSSIRMQENAGRRGNRTVVSASKRKGKKSPEEGPDSLETRRWEPPDITKPGGKSLLLLVRKEPYWMLGLPSTTSGGGSRGWCYNLWNPRRSGTKLRGGGRDARQKLEEEGETAKGLRSVTRSKPVITGPGLFETTSKKNPRRILLRPRGRYEPCQARAQLISGPRRRTKTNFNSRPGKSGCREEPHTGGCFGGDGAPEPSAKGALTFRAAPT